MGGWLCTCRSNKRRCSAEEAGFRHGDGLSSSGGATSLVVALSSAGAPSSLFREMQQGDAPHSVAEMADWFVKASATPQQEYDTDEDPYVRTFRNRARPWQEGIT